MAEQVMNEKKGINKIEKKQTKIGVQNAAKQDRYCDNGPQQSLKTP